MTLWPPLSMEKELKLLRGLRVADKGLVATLHSELATLRNINSAHENPIRQLQDTQKRLQEQTARLENVETAYADQIAMLKRYPPLLGLGAGALAPAINETNI